MQSVSFIIPAYEPPPSLLEMVRELRALSAAPILIVNDGSTEQKEIFASLSTLPGVTVLHHAVNLGKGSALKTAFNYHLVQWPSSPGVVTLDADGQHRPEDAMRVASQINQNPNSLILGCRRFSKDQKVPLRSRFGNQLTRKVFKAFTGVAVSDTQTGLRGIPRSLMTEMLHNSSSGYDFETEMLIESTRLKIAIKEMEIPTIYINENQSSHFNPLLDSIKIYFVFIRHTFNSMATALIDFLAFSLVISLGGALTSASFSSRLVAGIFNFYVSKWVVFKSKEKLAPEVMRYASLVLIFFILSNTLIGIMVDALGANVFLAKILVESFLFTFSFIAQRLIIFPVSQSRSKQTETDWDAYYQKPFKATSITRKITTRRILNCFNTYGDHLTEPHIAEFGGGNSCVYGAIAEELRPQKYTIIDKNRTGLQKFFNTYPKARSVELVEGDVLNLKDLPEKADICFSIGLIEHFSPEGTKEAVKAHFKSVKEDGIVLITFPTPTWLYRLTRGIAELLNMWKFHDERPCTLKEVTSYVETFAEIKHCSIIWPIFLTQGIIVAQPHRQSPP